jgi:glycosyltransferase involved in cell wall biosynthesis
MRIAYVCADAGVPVFGRKGCSIHVQELIRAFQEQGADVKLFAMNPHGIPSDDLREVSVHRFAEFPNGTPAKRELAAVRANRRLRRSLENEGAFDLVYERYSLWSYAGMEYARGAAIPGLLEVNAPLIEEQDRHRVLIHRGLAEQVTQRAFAAAAAVLAVSREVAAYVRQHQSTWGRVHIVPNGVNPDRFPDDIRPSCPGPPGYFTVGFVGTLKPWHGLSTLVEAFAMLRGRCPETRLLIVGDGTGRDNLLQDLSQRGLLGSSHLTGAVSPDEIPGLLASMDVAVCPYPKRDFYFSPLKVYEYMAAGLPVIVSSVGQLQELIKNEVTGLVIPPDDIEALVQALTRLLSEHDFRVRLGRAARRIAIRDHAWRSIAQEILALAGLEPAGKGPVAR